MDYTKEFLEEQYRKLPVELQEALSSVEMISSIEKIARDNELLLDQAESLADEIGLTILGLTKTSEFTRNIQKRLSIDAAAAEIITSEVNTRIFLQIRAALKKVQESRIDFDEEKIIEQKKREEVKSSLIKSLLNPKMSTPAPQQIETPQGTFVRRRLPPAPTEAIAVKPPTVPIKPPEVKMVPPPAPTPKAPEPKPAPPPKPPEPPKIAYVAPREETGPKVETRVQDPKKKVFMDPYLMNRDRLLYEIENPSSTSHGPYPFDTGIDHTTQPKPKPRSSLQVKIDADIKARGNEIPKDAAGNTEAPQMTITTPKPAPTITPSPSPIYSSTQKPADLPIPQTSPKPEVKTEPAKETAPVGNPALVPEIAPEYHIAIKRGETVHDVPIPPQNLVKKEVREPVPVSVSAASVVNVTKTQTPTTPTQAPTENPPEPPTPIVPPKMPAPPQPATPTVPTPDPLPKPAEEQVVAKQKTSVDILNQKLSTVVAPPTEEKKRADPYREPIN